jgi:hypothetical protein
MQSATDTFKMQCNGENFDFTESRRYYTNAKTVHEKITYKVECALASIERSNTKKLLNEMALAKAKKDFPNSAVQVKEYYRKYYDESFMVQVVLDNGIKINLLFFKDDEADDGVRFEVKELENTTALTVNGLIGALAKASPRKQA